LLLHQQVEDAQDFVPHVAPRHDQPWNAGSCGDLLLVGRLVEQGIYVGIFASGAELDQPLPESRVPHPSRLLPGWVLYDPDKKLDVFDFGSFFS
jgi:hypothetical protein